MVSALRTVCPPAPTGILTNPQVPHVPSIVTPCSPVILVIPPGAGAWAPVYTSLIVAWCLSGRMDQAERVLRPGPGPTRP